MLLAVALFLWGLHHLDYPFLRAQGAWNPWGYYLDIVFGLAMAAGIVFHLRPSALTRGIGGSGDRRSECESLFISFPS